MTDRAPYNIVCLDYLVYLVYITTGSIGGNGSIRLPVVSVVMVVSGCCSISQNRDLCVFVVFGVSGMILTRRQRRGRRILYVFIHFYKFTYVYHFIERLKPHAADPRIERTNEKYEIYIKMEWPKTYHI